MTEKMEVSFEGSLNLHLAAERVQSLLFPPSQKQKEDSIEDLLNRLIVLLPDKSIIETQFLKTG